MRFPWTLSFQTAEYLKTNFSYQSIWTANLELIQWWISDSKTIRFSVVLTFIDSADTLYKHLLHLAAAPLLSPPNVSVQVRQGPYSEKPGPVGEGLTCSRNLAWGLISAELSAGCPERERQPFPFKGRFLFHNLPTTSLLQGLLRGTGAAKKPGRRSWALVPRMSGGPAALVPLQPDGWSQSTNWKTISPQRTQKAQELLPSETKRELVSSSRPQVLLRWFVRDDHHPTIILPQNVLSLSSPLL